MLERVKRRLLGAKSRDKAVPPKGLKKKLWDRRRKKRATVPIGRHYERLLVPPSQRPELLHYLRQHLSKTDFFAALPGIYGVRVKRFDFHFYLNGEERVVPVVIKNTAAATSGYSPKRHGKDFEEIRDVFGVHQRAVHNGKIKSKTYMLRSPKVYDIIGDFVIMEYIDKLEKTPYWSSTRSELYENFSKLKVGSMPRVDHAMLAGNTNPKEPEKGKWIVFLPYAVK